MERKKIIIIAGSLATLCMSAFVFARTPLSPIFMPGTQPMEIMNITGSSTCRECHGGYDLSVEPAFNWKGSMMAQAARDPLMYAALAVANQDVPHAGDFCLRCHVPDGWLRGNSVPEDGSKFTPSELEGVQCDFCHRMVDPLSPEGKALVEPDVDKLESGKYVISPDNRTVRGPFGNTALKVHDAMESDFHKSGDFCGTCHDVTNPVFKNPETGQFAAVERTYSEWKNSDFSKIGDKGACQNCHMPPKWGTASDPKRFDSSFQAIAFRDYLNVHEFVGGNTFAQEILPLFWTYNMEEWDALQNSKEKAFVQLRKAATIDLSSDGTTLKVRVTNQTGHKLPTGYPEGRRMWINYKAFDPSGNLLFESGKYDFDTAELLKDKYLKVYEVKPGVSPEQAAKYGLTPGPTFHFVLNDIITKDNRIPPRGFTNAAFEAAGAGVYDYSYADGQYWDDTSYPVPGGTAKVEVTLYYQTASKEYIDFLKTENKTNAWGKNLYAAWAVTTKSMPVDTMKGNPMTGNSCMGCHGDKQKMIDLGYPQFAFDWAQVNAETGMSASCDDCHLGNPKDSTVEGAHKGFLGLLVMKNRYREVVKRKDLEGTPEYAQVSSIKVTSIDPRYKLQVTSPLQMLLWHDKNIDTAAWNPETAMKTCGRCHARQVAEFNTTEMGLVLTMSQYIPWIAPPQPGQPGTHLKVAPQSCGLWTEASIKPENAVFTDVNRQLYNSTSTSITPQFQDPYYPDTSYDPLTKLQSIANQRNCSNCHAGCLDCHFSPFAENVPGRMGSVKPAGTHTFTQRPLPMTCMSGGRGQFCHGGPTDRRRGDGFVKGGFAFVPPTALQTGETKAYLATPDIHYKSDTSHNATCVDCHGPLPGGKDYGLVGNDPNATHGNMTRNAEPARCAVCHPNEVAAYRTGNHRNLTCGACHTPKIVGYAFNFWTKGERFGISPYPMERHESYAANAMTPALLKDEEGMWAPYHVHPHISAHIDPSYLKVADYLSPRILWRNQPDIGIVRQHRSKDGVAVTGSYYGPDYGRDEGQVMVWLNIDKMAHAITSKASSLRPRTCSDCHTPDGKQRIGVTFGLRGNAYEDLYKGSYDIVADEKGLRIENLIGYKSDGTSSTALDPMKGKWSVPGSYLIPPAAGPATGHPAGL